MPRPLTTVLRLGTSAPLEHYEQATTPDAVLPAGTSDGALAEAFPWELAECLSGHHAACVLLGHGFSPWPAATVLAAAMHALVSAAERVQRDSIVRLRLSLVQILEDDKLADLLPGASDPSAPRLSMRECQRGSRVIGAVQRTVRGADEVQQLVQSALHAEGRPRAHATVAQLLVESHPRFGGGEVACGCVTVADLSGWDLARPGDALQASSTRSATDGADGSEAPGSKSASLSSSSIWISDKRSRTMLSRCTRWRAASTRSRRAADAPLPWGTPPQPGPRCRCRGARRS